MRTLREGETVISLPEPGPGPAINLDGARRAILAAPGCLAVQVDPPRESHGGVFIPDTVGGRLRADCGTVIAVGVGVSVRPGERVLLRPYHGLWVEPFESAEAPIVEVFDDGLRPYGCKVLIRPDRAPEQIGEFVIADSAERPVVTTGRVVGARAGSGLVVGSRVVYSRWHPQDGRTANDWVTDEIVALRESQVYATLGPSPYRADMVRFYGAGTDWRKSILMVSRDGDWAPVDSWELIERDMAASVHMPEVHAARRRVRATRLSGGACGALVDPNPRESLTFEMGDVRRERQLVPRSSVWALVG